MVDEGSELNNEKKSSYVSLPKFLTTVTPITKIISLVLFVALPFAGFYLGYLYGQSSVSDLNINNRPVILTKKLTPTSKPIITKIPNLKPTGSDTATTPDENVLGENDHYKVSINYLKGGPHDIPSVADIIIYDKLSKKSSTVSPSLDISGAIYPIWDPSGKFLLLSAGTYVDREIFTISLTTFKVTLGNFCAGGDPVFWNSYIIYHNCVGPFDPGTTEKDFPKIIAVNLLTNNTNTLMTFDKLTSVGIKRVEGNTLYYDKQTANESLTSAGPIVSETYDLSNLH